jgi:hypothetical protein
MKVVGVRELVVLREGGIGVASSKKVRSSHGNDRFRKCLGRTAVDCSCQARLSHRWSKKSSIITRRDGPVVVAMAPQSCCLFLHLFTVQTSRHFLAVWSYSMSVSTRCLAKKGLLSKRIKVEGHMLTIIYLQCHNWTSHASRIPGVEHLISISAPQRNHHIFFATTNHLQNYLAHAL